MLLTQNWAQKPSVLVQVLTARGRGGKISFFRAVKNGREKTPKPLRLRGFPVRYLFWAHNVVAGADLNHRPPGYEPDELPTAILRDMKLYRMVPVTGLEPVRHCCREILSLLCLPFHHTGGYWQGLEYHRCPRLSTVFGKNFEKYLRKRKRERSERYFS